MKTIKIYWSKLSDIFEKFETWFNFNFGWFFTNGMKAQQEFLEKTKKQDGISA